MLRAGGYGMLYANGLPYSPDMYKRNTVEFTSTGATFQMLKMNQYRVYLFIVQRIAALDIQPTIWLGSVGAGGIPFIIQPNVPLELWWDVHKTILTYDVWAAGFAFGDIFSVTEVTLNLPSYQESVNATGKLETLAAKIKRFSKRSWSSSKQFQSTYNPKHP